MELQFITHFLIEDLDIKIEYFPETDSLYIELVEKPSADSVEVSDGVVIDYDDQGNIVGIDIDQAGGKINLKELNLERLPFDIKKTVA